MKDIIILPIKFYPKSIISIIVHNINIYKAMLNNYIHLESTCIVSTIVLNRIGRLRFKYI